jgi:hypothetical protein
MSISLENLVEPDLYDQAIYDTLHMVLDRVIELGAKADTSEDADPEPAHEGEEGDPSFVSILRSQANFTPAERAEFQATGGVLNLLINVAVSRRSALYTLQEDLT